MKISRRLAWLIGAMAALAALFALQFSSSPNTVRGDVAPSFDESVNVQLNAAGIIVSWVSAAAEDGSVYYSSDGGTTICRGLTIGAPSVAEPTRKLT